MLIIEDDPDLLRALAFLLEARGYRVEVCAGGREAVASVAGRRFACLIIDQNLTDWQGIDLLARLRRQAVEGPAILITTAPTDGLRLKAAAAGVPIVEKPLLDDALLACLQGLARMH